ncbi:MAG: ABC transporter ATP-binding protein [Kiritimatiellaeota bacterium]|nr:ABC transporter ATP-binding protein [Kiritimatiellota bacterium]
MLHEQAGLSGPTRMPATVSNALLEAENLRVHFYGGAQAVRAVEDVSLVIGSGETVALVGESGCGKSVTALALARLVPQPPGRYVGGRVLFAGRDVLTLSAAGLRALRGRDIAYIFQEPGSSLNPVFTVGRQIGEAVRLYRPGADARAETLQMMHRVGLPEPERRQHSYPHELSGGQQQRVMIAMALVCRPRLLVADEPTTALDVTIQAQILDLLQALQRELGMAVLLITHNLGLVAETAHRVCVMYAGRIVESGAAEQVLAAPRHPYTRALLAAVPRLASGAGRLQGIAGRVPHPAHLPAGCAFHPRCPLSRASCRVDEPAWEEAPDRHGVRSGPASPCR